PGMKGTELVRRLKEIHPETEILYMSGYADRSGASFEGEGKRWIEQPFTTATLLERIRQVLATRSANEPSPG
ncbi:MAG: response regulator, partial [Deltaproteobacteria bacterium]